METITYNAGPDFKIHFRSDTNFLPDHPLIYTFKKIFNDDLYSEQIYFIADEIKENGNTVVIEGTVGYEFDATGISLVYNLEENKIFVDNSYRVMHSPTEYVKYSQTYVMTVTNPECELLVMDDGIPYVRFQRSKDGISIPSIIYQIFKGFDDPTKNKPLIVIPSELYEYNIKL
jgi:hypothetical protein